MGGSRVDIISFKRGINRWDRDYTAAFRFEYTADLEKRIRDVRFHDEESNRSAAIPWQVLRRFLTGATDAPYTTVAGTTLSKVGDHLFLSDPHGLAIPVQKDQMRILSRAAENVENDLTGDVRSLRQRITGA